MRVFWLCWKGSIILFNTIIVFIIFPAWEHQWLMKLFPFPLSFFLSLSLSLSFFLSLSLSVCYSLSLSPSLSFFFLYPSFILCLSLFFTLPKLYNSLPLSLSLLIDLIFSLLMKKYFLLFRVFTYLYSIFNMHNI